MLKSKATLFEYMKAHPDEVLEYCRGTRDGWWWMRPSFVKVHGNAARGLRKTDLLKAVKSDWRSNCYKLSKTD
jgi:hypothetical protein